MTPEQKQFIDDNYEVLSLSEIALRLRVHSTSVISYASKKKYNLIRSKIAKRLTEQDKDYIFLNYKTKTVNEMMAAINKPYQSIYWYCRTNKLQIKIEKEKEYLHHEKGLKESSEELFFNIKQYPNWITGYAY